MKKSIAAMMSKIHGDHGKELEELAAKHGCIVSWQFDGEDTCFAIVCDHEQAKKLADGISSDIVHKPSQIINKGGLMPNDRDSAAYQLGKAILDTVEAEEKKDSSPSEFLKGLDKYLSN